MRDSDRELVTLASEDSFGRIASRLERLAERNGEAGEEGASIELPMTQEELAGWAGASRESVARALRQMRRLGWVKTSRRTITILDLAALSARRAAA
jgi:CRP-like cAMP-binding protein